MHRELVATYRLYYNESAYWTFISNQFVCYRMENIVLNGHSNVRSPCETFTYFEFPLYLYILYHKPYMYFPFPTQI